MKRMTAGACALVAVLAASCEKNPAPDPMAGVPVTEVETFTEWPAYSPGISYDFSQDYPVYEMPQNNKTVSGEAWRIDDRWFTFVAGSNANKLVTEAAVRPMLERLNYDFDYLRDKMGWVPDRLAREGYRTTVCLYGSGLGTDNASNTDTGGWQSWYGNYPVLLLSYYPVYCFDPSCPYSDKDYHTYNVTHEGIHCLFSSMPGAQKASWFHEGSNTWLQNAMERHRAEEAGKSYAVDLGWLTTGHVLSPFIPIECYGGWRTDGTFGGYDWSDMSGDSRNILGGVQYSALFPSFLETALGEGAVKYVWQNAKNNVLACLASPLGEEGVRRMILEFRARTLLADMGIFSKSIMGLYNSYFQKSIKSESSVKVDTWKATPYVETELGADGWLVPEERTLPGWTGANVIPVHVTGESATVYFDPLESQDMKCMALWRTADGKAVYTSAVDRDGLTLDLAAGKPANGVIFILVCNTTYTYKSGLRRTHFGYRLRLGNGCEGTASTNLKWYDWTKEIAE